jgi:hypothetical protein
VSCELAIDYNEALISGAANMGGLLIGQALRGPATWASSNVTPANYGLPVTSLRGRVFMVGSAPRSVDTSHNLQQFYQDLFGAGISSAANSRE